MERTTTVELTDREIQLIERGLYYDNRDSEGERGQDFNAENYNLHNEFHALRNSLRLRSPTA